METKKKMFFALVTSFTKNGVFGNVSIYTRKCKTGKDVDRVKRIKSDVIVNVMYMN